MTSFIVFKGWEEEEEEEKEEEEEAIVASDVPEDSSVLNKLEHESPLLSVLPFSISSDSTSTALTVHSRSPSEPSIFLDSV